MSNVRYRLDLAFVGTGSQGWQSQKNGKGLQDLLRRAVQEIALGGRIPVGCSRTDSGVHARRYSAHVAGGAIRTCEQVLLGLNAALPGKMRIYRTALVGGGFHARYSCVQKTYRYHWHRGSVVPPPQIPFVHKWSGPLDEQAMARAAALFEGLHDFSQLTTAEGRQKGAAKNIDRCVLTRDSDLLVLEVRGRSFLHRMVRMIAGALLAVGTNRLDAGSLERVLAGQKPPCSIPALPARGLTLWDVSFSEHDVIEIAGSFPGGRDWPV